MNSAGSPDSASWPASPKGMGLGAFGLSVFVLSIFQAKLVDPRDTAVVLPIALIYGGGIQILAGVWELRRGDAFAAATFAGFGSFWISYYLLSQNIIATLPPATIPHAVGLFLWAWTIFVAYMWVASLYRSKAIFLAFTLALLALVLLSIGATGSHENVTKLGGYVGIALAIEVLYIALSEMITANAGHEVLPLGRPVVGRSAAKPSVSDERIHPGVQAQV
jgi:succinate-acetate transporter protein